MQRQKKSAENTKKHIKIIPPPEITIISILMYDFPDFFLFLYIHI